MRIQEVSGLTGLTQKTIRLYEEKGLISPGTVEKNGRTFRSYSEQDVNQLRMIAGLRKAFFSMDQIKIMMASPESIPGIMRVYREVVRSNFERLSALRDAVNEIDPEALRDVYQLSQELESATQVLSLPRADVTPHFRHLDEQYEPRPAIPERNRLFTKGYTVFIVLVLIVTALVLTSSYMGSRFASFSDKRYQIIGYPSDFTADTHVYQFHADDDSDIGMRDILVEQSRSEYGKPSRKGQEVYCVYQITAVRNSGETIFFKYIPESSTPRFRVEKQDGSVKAISRGTTSPYHSLRRQSLYWDPQGEVSADVIFVVDCIRAISSFVPFYKTALATVIIAFSVFFLSAGMKLVILPNFLWLTSSDPKKKLTGHGMAGTLGMIPVIENNKQFVDDD